MKIVAYIFAALAVILLGGCANKATGGSAFGMATSENSSRISNFQDAILLNAANDLHAVNVCFITAGGGVLKADGSVVLQGGAQGKASECVLMAGMLRTQSNMILAFSPFLTASLMSRVPAAPEEIIQSLIKDGLKFALMKFGISSVTKVIETGQLAQTQLAEAAINKPPVVLTPSVIQVPMGSSVLTEGGAAALTP